MKSKKQNKLFIIIPTVIALCVSLYLILNIVFSPYWNSVYTPSGYLSLYSMSAAESSDINYTKEQAVEDLDYVVKCLERVHPLYKGGISEEVQKCLDTEKDSFGETVTSYELWRAAARLLNSTGDSHNMVMPSFSRNYLVDYIDKNEQGYEVTAINGLTVDEIFNKSNDLFSYELEAWGKNAMKNCFQTLEGLKFLGFDTDKIKFTYISPNGDEETITYSQDDFVDYETAVQQLERETEDSPAYSYEIDSKNNVGIVKIDSCEYDSDYKEFIYNFFTEVIEGDIDNVVVDLRNNSGGNSQTADEFVMYLDQTKVKTQGGSWRLGPYTMNWKPSEENIKHYDDMLFDGNVYVLTSSNTFSSGMLFAEIIQDNGFGKVVGEPCGNMPDSYGDVVVFQTPNAILSFQISSKHFERIDASKSDLPIVPDILCDADEALKIVLNLI